MEFKTIENPIIFTKEVQIVYKLFLLNCYLLHVPRLPSQPASNVRGWVIEKNWLELAWQYIAMTRNNLSIIWISLHIVIECPLFPKVNSSQFCIDFQSFFVFAFFQITRSHRKWRKSRIASDQDGFGSFCSHKSKRHVCILWRQEEHILFQNSWNHHRGK